MSASASDCGHVGVALVPDDPGKHSRSRAPPLSGVGTQDVVQIAWLRLNRADAEEIRSLPVWLTTVTTRLCLDRLRAKVPEPVDHTAYEAQDVPPAIGLDPLGAVTLADSVGVALNVVLESLPPSQRVAFVLHDTFGIEFATIARVLDTSPPAARKLASRPRAKISARLPSTTPADWEVVDDLLDAAEGEDFARLLHLLAPDVVMSADAVAIASGTPERLEGRLRLHGPARSCRMCFRAAPEVLQVVCRRQGAELIATGGAPPDVA